MGNVLNWGILGASDFARRQMAPAIHLSDNGRLYALATGTPSKAAEFQAFCPDLRVHLTYDDLLADPEVEAVYVPLPNHLHVEWTKKALRAGKHVLCEKPIALKTGEIEELVALRDQTGLRVAEAFMIVHHPQWQRARALLQDGVLGDLRHVDGVFSYFNDDMDNIRNHAEMGGGGIRDIGVYPYGATRFVTGQEPLKISHAKIGWENGVDTEAHVWADFDGFTMAAQTSMRRFARQEMVFHGDKGMMRLAAPFNADLVGEPRIELFRAGQPDLIERFPVAKQYRNQVEAFGQWVRAGAEYPWPLEAARGSQAMIDEIFETGGSAPLKGQ